MEVRAKEEVVVAEIEVEAGKVEVAAAEEKVEKTEQKVEKTEQKVKEAKEEVKEAEQKVKEAEQKVDKAEQKVEKAKEEVKEAEQKVKEAKEEVKEAEQKVEKAEQKFDAATEGPSKDLAQNLLDIAVVGLRSAQDGVQLAQDGVKLAHDGVKSAHHGLDTSRGALDAALEVCRKLAGAGSGGQGAGAARAGGQVAGLQAGGSQGTGIENTLMSCFSMLNTKLASIEEHHVAMEEHHVAVKEHHVAVKDAVARNSAAIEAMQDSCDMPKASEGKHMEHFQFITPGLPPMVKSSDCRIQPLVEILRKWRLKNFTGKHLEEKCRSEAIDPFFRDVASSLGTDVTCPSSSEYSMRVSLGRIIFKGNPDLVVGPINGHPRLVVEIKPMAGDKALKSKEVSKLIFVQKTQIALYSVACQSLFQNTGNPFTCLLTNLNFMFVVQPVSFNGRNISVKIFTGVSDETDFVRALLKAADSNEEILTRPQSSTNYIVAEEFNSICQDPTVFIPLVLAGTGGALPNFGGHQTGDDRAADCITAKTHSQARGVAVEKLMPSQHVQQHGIKDNYTRTWIRFTHTCQQEYGDATNLF